MTAEVNNSRIIVEICPAGTDGCSNGSTPAKIQDGKIRIQEGLASEQLRVAVEEAASFKVLDFSTMKNAFLNFTDQGTCLRSDYFKARPILPISLSLIIFYVISPFRRLG